MFTSNYSLDESAVLLNLNVKKVIDPLKRRFNCFSFSPAIPEPTIQERLRFEQLFKGQASSFVVLCNMLFLLQNTRLELSDLSIPQNWTWPLQKLISNRAHFKDKDS